MKVIEADGGRREVLAARGRQTAIAATLIIGILSSCPALAGAVMGRVVIEGTSDVTARLVSARMGLYPGDRVDFEKLAAAQQRLIASDLFTRVRVYVALPTE